MESEHHDHEPTCTEENASGRNITINNTENGNECKYDSVFEVDEVIEDEDCEIDIDTDHETEERNTGYSDDNSDEDDSGEEMLIEIYKCEKCPFYTKRKKSLDKHSSKHYADPDVYKCKTCMFKTKEKSHLASHYITMHLVLNASDMYKCSQCDFESKWKTGLAAHMIETHFIETQLPNVELKKKRQRIIKVHKCPECSWETKNGLHALKQHKKSRHSEPDALKQYRCDKCDYSSNWKTNFLRHASKHDLSGKLTVHKCPKCTFEYDTKLSLYIHLDEAHGIIEKNLHKCPKCIFKTKRKKKFNMHMKTHEEHNMYKCPDAKCEYIGNTKKYLARHVKRVHRSVQSKTNNATDSPD